MLSSLKNICESLSNPYQSTKECDTSSQAMLLIVKETTFITKAGEPWSFLSFCTKGPLLVTFSIPSIFAGDQSVILRPLPPLPPPPPHHHRHHHHHHQHPLHYPLHHCHHHLRLVLLLSSIFISIFIFYSAPSHLYIRCSYIIIHH